MLVVKNMVNPQHLAKLFFFPKLKRKFKILSIFDSCRVICQTDYPPGNVCVCTWVVYAQINQEQAQWV